MSMVYTYKIYIYLGTLVDVDEIDAHDRDSQRLLKNLKNRISTHNSRLERTQSQIAEKQRNRNTIFSHIDKLNESLSRFEHRTEA